VRPPEFCLDQQSLSRVIPVGTLLKGLSLYHAHKVFDVSVLALGDAQWQIEGKVQGTGKAPYAQTVLVDTDGDARLLKWQATCSCPAGPGCKHAAALTLKASFGTSRVRAASAPTTSTLPTDPEAVRRLVLDIKRKAAEDKVTQWLGSFDHVDDEAVAGTSGRSETTPAKAADREERYVYLLIVVTTGSQRRLALKVAVSYLTQKGSWAKSKRVPSYVHAGMALHDTASAIDNDLLRLVRGLGGDRYDQADGLQGLLEGHTGTLALQLAQQTGRLFMVGPRNELLPVAAGQAMDLNWDWVTSDVPETAQTQWALHPRLPAPGAELFANDPPIYMDTQQQLCGPVQAAGVPSEHLRQLLDAPPFPVSAIKQHEAALLTRLAGLPLPPVLKAPAVIQGVVPIACLHLLPVSQSHVHEFGLLRARLRFDYDGLTGFWPNGRTAVLTRNTGGESVLLHRDVPQETSFIERLKTLGLAGEPDDLQGHFYIPGECSQQPWLQWVDSNGDALRDAGFDVSFDAALDGWIARGDTLDVSIKPLRRQDDDVNDDGTTSPWFDLSLGLEINGVRHNILPLLPDLLAHLTPDDNSTGDAESDAPTAPALVEFVFLAEPGGNFLRLPTEALRPWIGALLDLVGDRARDFGQGTLRLSRLDALRLGAALGEGVAWDGTEALRQMVDQLQGRNELPTVALPPSLRAELRPYQQLGLNWLQFLRQHGLGGILADDMGLGKTVQTLAHIQVEKDAGRLTAPALIVAPVSLMGNWQREAARFCPGLRTLVLHGQDRHAAADQLSQHDIVIAPYSLLHRDRERWLQTEWHLVVLDEAQNIKNASTNAAQVVSQLVTRHRLCLSGTPMENHLGEIWSLFHFLMPGFLGSEARFKKLFRTPIEKHGDGERLAQLRHRITPFMLRRTKDLVATELPPKVETVMRAELQGKQADLYETIRLTTEKAVREALDAKGLAKSHITVLDALLKLRQVCCDPRLVPLEAARKVTQSAKLEQLMEMLPEMLAEGRRVLLFSQFTSMLSLIEAELKVRNLSWVKLTGQSQKRDELIERFTSGEVPLFLISLKAGGVGLNLPQADTVIHYDPWWNPAVETQATDRAHRIGQTKSVWVIKLVAQGTIEERILALQERKAALAESMYSGAQGRKQPLFTENDLQELLKPLDVPSAQAT
jgi:superfamily II DNA or RNA helicase